MKNTKSYYQLTRPEVIDFLPKQYSKVLEIGCAEGDFRRNLDKNCEYWGIEPVSSVAEIAKKNLDKVLIGTFTDTYDQLPNNYFNLVICNDVIEHMADHDHFLQSIKKKLVTHAYISGSIPNVRYLKNLLEILLKKDWKYKPYGILDNTHLRFFTEKSLKRTISENGYTIEKMDGINNLLGEFASIDGMYRRLKYCLPILLLGQDTKYMQFGICIKLKSTNPNLN